MKSNKFLFLTTILFICSVSISNAQNKYLENPESVRVLSKKIANLFVEKKSSVAFDEMLDYWPLPTDEFEDLRTKTLKYMNILDERFGGIIGNVKVNEEKISDIAVRETYIVRYNYSAIRLIFTYYKSDKGWVINSFKWDDSFTEEFKSDK